MKRNYILLFTVSIAVLSCNLRKETVVETPEPIAKDAYVCSDTVTYLSSIKSIFDARCIKCHSGQRPAGGIDLASFEKASLVVDFRLTCAVNWEENCNRMPPLGAQLTELQRNLISCWVVNGRKN